MADMESTEKLLLSLIYPVTPGDMDEDQSAQFDLAVQEQSDYAAEYSGNIKAEAVGDVKISYDIPTGKRAPMKYYGQPISPAVIVRLTSCGLMRRWI